MLDEEIDAIEKRANAATEAPWEFVFASDDMPDAAPSTMGILRVPGDWPQTNVAWVPPHGEQRSGRQLCDGAFIAAARSDVPALVASLRATRSALRQLADAVDRGTVNGFQSRYEATREARTLLGDAP